MHCSIRDFVQDSAILNHYFRHSVWKHWRNEGELVRDDQRPCHIRSRPSCCAERSRSCRPWISSRNWRSRGAFSPQFIRRRDQVFWPMSQLPHRTIVESSTCGSIEVGLLRRTCCKFYEGKARLCAWAQELADGAPTRTARQRCEHEPGLSAHQPRTSSWSYLHHHWRPLSGAREPQSEVIQGRQHQLLFLDGIFRCHLEGI